MSLRGGALGTPAAIPIGAAMGVQPFSYSRLVAAAVFLSVTAVSSVPSKDNAVPTLKEIPEKFNVIIVTVHGPYSPVDNVEDALQLTKNGKEVMRSLGKTLVERYQLLLRQLIVKQKSIDDSWTQAPDQKPRLVQVTAIDKEIARTSALKIINGMQQKSQEFAMNMDIELSGKNIDQNKFFNALSLNEQEKGKCKEFDKLMEELKNLKDKPKPKSLISNLFKSNNAEEEDDDKVFQNYDRLQMEFLEKGDLPSLKTRKKGIANMRTIAIRRMKNLIGDDIKYWKFFVSPMLTSISDDFKIPMGLATSQSQLEERQSGLHIHVVDTHLMTVLIWWLNQEERLSRAYLKGKPDFYPQVGDTLIIEINDKMNFEVAYVKPLNTAEAADNPVGFSPIAMQIIDAEDKPLLEHIPVSWIWYVFELLKDPKRWSECCDSSRC